MLVNRNDAEPRHVGITVNGKAVKAPTGNASFAVIDTGTTLIEGPPEAIAAIYAQIPGAAPGTGSYEGYYTFRMYTSP